MQQSTPEGEPLDILNSLRAVAALLVCLFHASFILAPFFPQAAQLLDVGQYGVYVFFVISGVVIPLALEKANYRINDFFVFMQKRIIRLMPPLIASATIVALSSLFVLQSDFIPLLKQWLASITLTSPLFDIPWVNEVYWTLYVEMQYYIYIGIMFPLLHNSSANRRRLLLAMLLALSFVSLCTGGYEKSKLPFQLPVFLMGYITFLFYKKRISTSEFFVWLLLCATVCFYLVGYLHGFGYTIGIMATLTALVVAFVHRGLRRLSALGEYSYSFYLMHWPAISVLSFCFGSALQTPWGSIVAFVTVPLFSMIVARLFYQFTEKPALRWAKRIRYKN